MEKYEVMLGEVVVHSLEVKAASEREAIEKAKYMIGNLSDKQLASRHQYTVETVGWDGYEEVYELAD